MNAKSNQVLYILISVWVLHTPNASRNSHFQHFLQKNAKKVANLK